MKDLSNEKKCVSYSDYFLRLPYRMALKTSLLMKR